MISQQAIRCMLHNGGAFATSLARSFMVADDKNRERLAKAFPEIVKNYEDMAKEKANKESGGEA